MKPALFTGNELLWIAGGGAAGSVLRLAVSSGYTGTFPLPTLFINVLGTIALALLHVARMRMHPNERLLYMIGFCGSFTTVSTYASESIHLLLNDRFLAAGLNMTLPPLLAVLLASLILQYWPPERSSA